MARCDLLVTGAHGFVGRHVLARARTAGLDVVASEGDLRRPLIADRQVVALRPRAVVHLAAAPRGSGAWPTLRAELAMAAELIAALARHAPQAPLLVAGSAAQYGMGTATALSEGDPVAPVSAYGVCKAIVERAVTADALRDGVRVIFTRSFNHVGPGQGPDAPVAQWAQAIATAEAAGGGAMRVGDLGVVRDFLDVRDVADAYLALVRSDAAGVVNVCSGVATPLHEIVDALIARSRVPVTVERDAALLRRSDPPHVVGDPKRLRELTGWSPSIALEQSVEDMLAELRDAGGVPAPDPQAARS